MRIGHFESVYAKENGAIRTKITIELDERTTKDLHYLQDQAPKRWTNSDIIGQIIRNTAKEMQEWEKEDKDE